MLTVLVRVLIIYITVLLFLRLMGKRQIGEMQPYEVVITLIIADLATLPMSDTNIPLLHGILPLAALVLLHFFITTLTRKSVKIRRLMSGRPVVVISPNGIEYQALRELNMNLDDLVEMIRQVNYYSFDQILYAIIETNGKISVIPTSEYAPTTAGDLNISNPPVKLPHLIISDGKVLKEEAKIFKLNGKTLQKILDYLKAKSVKDILVLSLDEYGKVYFQAKNQKFQIVENIFEVIGK